MEYDLFISHASEDKLEVARPLAEHLQSRGLRVWLDELELTLGDSLRRSIDQGLSRSKYGLVILSPAFFLKEWPNKELDGLVAREDGREKVVLPVWHNVSATDIVKHSPILADKVAVSTTHGLTHVADRVVEAVRRAPGGEGVQIVLRERDAELLVKLRRQMLASTSEFELRQNQYEIEAYLARYPHSPEARLLRDQIRAAIRNLFPRHKRQGPSAESSPKIDSVELRTFSRKRALLRWLIIMAGLGGLLYALYALLYFSIEF